MIKSGSTLPVKKITKEPLYKIVPSGGNPPTEYTPYWITASELNKLQTSSAGSLGKLGLPLETHSIKFDVYEIRPKSSATVFESIVAPTQQGGETQAGGAIQTLVPDRTQFNEAVKVDNFQVNSQ
ncbi:hypothetical protein [Endozoicomonas acroporae]|uniref:hypothetical protein n=1 Tax=Endozoicomonas acroporae TaxID=1701104 RepID=UPI003D7B8678